MTTPLLEGRAITHCFGGPPVLDAVELTLRPGSLLCVLGPNGSGKTTLLRVLAGVLSPLAGEVRLGGEQVDGLSRRAVARRLAVVAQEHQVPFPFRVREMVAMGRAPHLGPLGLEGRSDREAVEGALGALGLIPLAERTFPTLSGGEKQRVMLARALAQDTPILLLDEPTAHMDLGHRLHTLEWLRFWIAQRPSERAALLVTHDLVLAARFADSVLLLERGHAVAQGPPSKVLSADRIARVYEVEVEISHDAAGRPVIVAQRSRIRYPGSADAPNR
ncbi:MAG: ABC transporter ATP-binding protein [Myxococcota bacterium]